jgi:hypothetical protein
MSLASRMRRVPNKTLRSLARSAACVPHPPPDYIMQFASVETRAINRCFGFTIISHSSMYTPSWQSRKDGVD